MYEFVVRHFLACCSQDAQGKETTVEINIADETVSAFGQDLLVYKMFAVEVASDLVVVSNELIHDLVLLDCLAWTSECKFLSRW